MESIACIYHKNCIDGTTAAAVVLRKFPDALMFPISHHDADTAIVSILEEIPRDAVIYIVDTTSGLEACLERGHEVIVLEHHVSEQDRVTAIAAQHANCTYVCDIEKSGASLAWSYLFPHEPIPALVAHVEDNDIWLQRTPTETEEVINVLALHHNNPTTVLGFLSDDITAIREKGAILAQKTEAEVQYFIGRAPQFIHIGGNKVPVFNITNHQSKCGNILSTKLGATVALYTIDGGDVRMSFRGTDAHTPSALALATQLGGGGHRNSAGARMSLKDFIHGISSE